VARVVVWVPDLLFGSNVLGILRAAGHEAVLVPDAERAAQEAPGSDVVVVDLTADAAERLAALRGIALEGARTLAFYSHVEADVRAQAEAAGLDRVVPRSRMAREAGALVEGLAK
jgi:hypothetical protein